MQHDLCKKAELTNYARLIVQADLLYSKHGQKYSFVFAASGLYCIPFGTVGFSRAVVGIPQSWLDPMQ
jgi:hypothetical protein